MNDSRLATIFSEDEKSGGGREKNLVKWFSMFSPWLLELSHYTTNGIYLWHKE
jgi:hypothetical protein